MSICKSNNYKGYVVEIRPPRWHERIWIGRLETVQRARYVADAVRHYVGEPPFHFPERILTLPTIMCIGTEIGNPVELSTQEMCANYVSKIAKGKDFKPQRDDFIRRVKDAVKNLDFSFQPSPYRESKASTDESAPPPVQMELMNEPEFSTPGGGNLVGSSDITLWRSKARFITDSGGISGGSSGTASWRYNGVSSHEANKWVAEIRVPKGHKGNKIWLGTYPTPLEAAFAYDVAVTFLDGDESMLNFHHPIYKQIPRILPDLSPLDFDSECKKVVKEFLMLAKEVGNSVPMALVGKPKYNTDSGGNPGGLLGTSRECSKLCPECGKIFLSSESMLLHLMDHWRNQKSSSPPQSSRDSGGDSQSPGMDSRWWLMYKGVRYWQVYVPGALAIPITEELLSKKWGAWIWLPDGNEILLDLYSTTLEAAYAYDVAVTCLGGEPLLNFCGHSIYKEVPRISQNLSPQDFATRLKNVVKEFGKLAMEGGYYGMPEKETLEALLAQISAEAKADKNLNAAIQLDSDLDTFQKNKHHGFGGISYSDDNLPELHFLKQLDEDISEAPKADMEMLDVSPPHFRRNVFNVVDTRTRIETIEPSNTRNKQPYQPISPGHDVLSGSPNGALKFTMVDLNNITANFSESLTVGQGGSGSVYRGQLKDGTTVAVKRIKKNGKNVLEIEDAKDFQTEANTLFKEKHLNLVRLLGFLEDENELILVMEYVTNGNLRQHLDGVSYGVTLDMSKRCRISLDVATALKHLHNQTKDDLDIIHRDIKSLDILITNDFRAKVVGFGLSQRSPIGDGASSSSTLVKGTLGHMAHEHSTTHHLKEKNDVYSFGKLLVEIFTRQHFEESSLPNDKYFTPIQVLEHCVEGRLMDIIDPKITPTTFELEILEQIFKLATSCLVNHATVEDIFGDLSFIVGDYFGDLKNESNSKGDKYKIQKEQKGDLEAYIEPNSQNLCLEELEAWKEQLPKHLVMVDSSNPSSMAIELDGSLFIEGFESNKVQTSIQLEVDSKQATSQVVEQLVTKQDQTSPSFTNIIPDEFQLKSDETYFEMLQEDIAKLGYISRILSQGDEFEQNLTNIGKTSFFLYFNEKDDVFEFYFKNYQGMAIIVGVGLECAKVVLEDGWRVTIQEISKPSWDDAWKNFDSSSTMKVTISNPLEGVDNMEDSLEPLASIPRGQCLLLDLAQYFILKMAIASFLPRDPMTRANNGSGTSSNQSNQDIAEPSSSSDAKFSSLLQSVRNLFTSQIASNQLKTKSGDGPPMDPLGDDVVKFDTTVHLKLLPGGDLYNGNDRLDSTILDDELKTLTSQLDDTIYLEMMFKFVNEDDMKEIQVTIGPISFQFQVKNEVNYKTTKRFGWYHKSLDVSFGPVNTCDSEIGPNHNALDIVKVKKTITIGSSDATTNGTLNSMNGGVQGKIPHILTLYGGGSSGWSTTKCVSDNVGYAIEKEFEETRGGFVISSERNLLSSTLEYTYCAPNYMHEVNSRKLPHEDYRKHELNLLPICHPQDVKFEGTWHPKDSENNPQIVAEYSLYTSREVHMTSKEISKKVVKKSWTKRSGHPKIQEEINGPLKYTQKYARSLFLNHAMTHLNGKKFRVEEVLSQCLNERELETHLVDRSSFAPLWHANPLIGLNSSITINREL